MKSKALLVLCALSSFAFPQEQRRIVRPVNDASRVRLQGTRNPRLADAVDEGAVSPDMQLSRMMLVLSPSSQQQSDLDQLLVEQQDSSSANYHKWLTPEQFADRFGVSQSDIATLSAWLSSQGFTVDEIARARNWIAFNGTAAQVEAAFGTPIHNYLVGGKAHFAASSNIAIPEAFSGVVTGVTGLHDFGPKPRNISTARPRLTSSTTGNHFLVPGDFATIYNLPGYTADATTGIKSTPCTNVTSPCIDGTGQTIAIVGQTNLSTDSNHAGSPGVNGQQYDVVTFRDLAGLPPINLTIKLKGADPGVIAQDVDEANLDIEWAGAIAPNAAIIYYIEGPYTSGNGSGSTGAFAALLDAVNDDQAQVISISYGTCEVNLTSSDQTNLTQAGQQANAQGQSIVAPSGDSGAADCDSTMPATFGLSVDFPGSMPYATSIGGTTFAADTTNSSDPTQPTQYWNGSTNNVAPSAFSYILEQSWNDSSANSTGQISATGGGASIKFAKPSWQTGPGVPSDGARDVPDLAFAAVPSHDGYLICSQSSCVNGYLDAKSNFDVIGGTSAGAPTFAGILALYNQIKASAQGNINQDLYQVVQNYPLSGNSNTSWAYHDITTGNNIVACRASTADCPSSGSYGYTASAGFDLVSGLGSADAAALLDALNGTPNPHFTLLPNSRSQSLSILGSSVFNVAVTSDEGFTGNVGLTCSYSSSLAGAACNIQQPTVAAPGNTGINIGPGSMTTPATGTLTVTGTSGSLTYTTVVNVAFTNPDFQLTSANSSESLTQGTSTTDTITVTPIEGFSGNVSLSCTGTTGLTCSVSPSPVTVGPSATTSTVTVNATGSADSGSITVTGTSSGLTHTLQIPISVTTVSPNFVMYASAPTLSLSSGGSSSDTLTFMSLGSFNSDVALTCSVASSLESTTCSINTTTIPGGN